MICKDKQVKEELNKKDFDAAAKLNKEKDGVYLQISLDRNWLREQKRKLVTTASLRPAQIPGLYYFNIDGDSLKIDTDFFGKPRNTMNPSPGPFEITHSGIQKIKLR